MLFIFYRNVRKTPGTILGLAGLTSKQQRSLTERKEAVKPTFVYENIQSNFLRQVYTTKKLLKENICHKILQYSREVFKRTLFHNLPRAFESKICYAQAITAKAPGNISLRKSVSYEFHCIT